MATDPRTAQVPEVGTDEWRPFVLANGGFRNESTEPVDDRLAAIYFCHRWAEAASRALDLEVEVERLRGLLGEAFLRLTHDVPPELLTRITAELSTKQSGEGKP